VASVQTDDAVYDQINITPMLDLAYVLLVIFVIMTTATVQGMRVNLPKPGKKPPQQQIKKPPPTKAISVAEGGQLYLNGKPVSQAELEQALIQQKAETPEFPVVVAGEDEVSYQAVIEVMDMLVRLDITTVGLATKKLVVK
jgi:biopolymer transport protein ExbD